MRPVATTAPRGAGTPTPDGAPETGAATGAVAGAIPGAATIPAPATPEAAPDEVDRVTKWVIILFFVALFIPGSFYMGVRMTPFRLLLIAMAIPMLLRFRNDTTIRITAIDVLVFLATAWRGLALVANHGTAQLVFAGASFMELFFAYLLGRAYVRNLADHRFFFKCFLGFLIVSLPFGLMESVTKTRVLQQIASIALEQTRNAEGSPQIRFGLMRVQLSFDHAILFGTFCVLGFANVFYLYRFPRNVVRAGFVAFMTLLAISSSSILALALQGGLIAYEHLLRPLRSKWVLLILGIALFLGSFQMLFGMSPMEYVAFNLTLNVSGALARFDQIHYGLLEIQRSPFFGIGLAPFTRPFWRADVFDNFWLAMAVRYGAPTTIFFVLAFVGNVLRVALAQGLNAEENRARIGYVIPFCTLLLALGTHSIWGSGMVYVLLYVGIGGWFFDRAPRLSQRRIRPGPPRAADHAPEERVANRPRPAARPEPRAGARVGVRVGARFASRRPRDSGES